MAENDDLNTNPLGSSSNQNLPVGAHSDSDFNQSPENAKFSWSKILQRARHTALLTVVIFAVIMVSVGLLIYFWLVRKPVPLATDNQRIDGNSTVLPGSSLGREGEILTIAAETNFKGRVAVAGDLDVAGKLNSATPLNIAALQVAGATTLSTADVQSNLSVEGNSNLQGNVTVASLLSAGSLNVAGNGSVGGTLTVGNFSTRNQTITGVLTLGGHVISGGALPGVSAGSAVGGAGTVSISGNDRAGTITINVGQSPPAGVLATITFRSAYSSTPRVTVSPIGASSGGLQYYLNRTSGGFTISTLNAPPQGTSFAFDYIVEQ